MLILLCIIAYLPFYYTQIILDDNHIPILSHQKAKTTKTKHATTTPPTGWQGYLQTHFSNEAIKDEWHTLTAPLLK